MRSPENPRAVRGLAGRIFDAADRVAHLQACFVVHAIELESGAEICTGKEFGVVAGDPGALAVQLGTVGQGVGENCDEAAGALDQAADGPGSECE